MIIRQKAFEGAAKMQKVQLHCHTTRSDGKLTPKELLYAYAEEHFDLVAITDHRFYNRENFAPETGIVIIPGMEIDTIFESDDSGLRCFHTLVLGPNDGTNGYAQDERVASTPYNDPEKFRSALDEAHARNNITIYCHPEWSRTPARCFEDLGGYSAMEIWNSTCAVWYEMDTNAAYWNEVIAHGRKWFGVATDDTHSRPELGRGYIMVNAEKNAASVIAAIKEGAFYASCGPVIKDFYLDTDENTVHVETTGAARVWLIRDKQPNLLIGDGTRGDVLHASHHMTSHPNMIRVCVVDANGRRAWTNPLFPGDGQ